MSRTFQADPRHKLGVAAVIDAIVSYADAAAPQTETERGLLRRLSELDPDRSISQRMASNFRSVTDRHRITAFGDFTPGDFSLMRRAVVTGLVPKQDDPPDTVMFHHDDVGEVQIPEYPPGTTFAVQYNGFYCNRSSGDRPIIGPSDEPYFVTVAVWFEDDENQSRRTDHPFGDPDERYGGIDDGSFRRGPVVTCFDGPLPRRGLTLITVVMENDEGEPNAYAEEIGLVVSAAAFLLGPGGILANAAIAALANLALNWLLDTEDDMIGTTNTVLSARDLLIYSRNPTRIIEMDRLEPRAFGFGGVQFVTVRDVTDVPSHIAAHASGDADYYIAYEVIPSNPPLPPEDDDDGGIVLPGGQQHDAPPGGTLIVTG